MILGLIAVFRNGCEISQSSNPIRRALHSNFNNLAFSGHFLATGTMLAQSKLIIMLRITKTFEDESTVILRLDGSLDSSTIAELEEEYEVYKQNPKKILLLDLGGITFVSHNGLKLLQKLKNAQVKLGNGSLFIETLLSDLKD